MGSIPLLATQVRPPDSPLDSMGRVTQLSNLLQEQRLRQQLAPSQVATAQSQAELAGTEAESARMKFGYEKNMYDAWADPGLRQMLVPSDTSDTTSGYKPGTIANALVQWGQKNNKPIPLPLAIQQEQPFLEYHKTLQQMDKDNQDLHNKSLDTFLQRFKPIVDEKDPDQKQSMLSNLDVNPDDYPGFVANEKNIISQIPKMDPQHLDTVYGYLGATDQVAKMVKSQSDATVAQISAEREKAGKEKAEQWQPSDTHTLVSGLIQADPKSPGIYGMLQDQAEKLYEQSRGATGKLEDADKAIIPAVQEANRIRALPENERAQMEAKTQAGMELARQEGALGYAEPVQINGKNYTFADQSRYKGSANAQYVGPVLHQAGITSLDEKTASTLRGLASDQQSLDEYENAIKNAQPTSALGRLLAIPENWAKKVTQLDPSLASLGVFQTNGLKTVRDLISSGGEGGMRGVSKELVKLSNKDLPQPGDTLKTATDKVTRLKSVLGNIADSILPQATSANRPSLDTFRPGNQNPKDINSFEVP